MSAQPLLSGWTVDYGDGPQAVTIPHAWNEDLPVFDEGPVVYENELTIPADATVLRFHGVSYAADVLINREVVTRHRGIWDAWEVPIAKYQGQSVLLTVRVTKNGGLNYPVEEAASGFLPYVFNTFGGIFREVEIDSQPAAAHAAPASRAAISGPNILLDGEPFYMRGILHWGWYPELGHPNPDEATIRAELAQIRNFGFNTVKFCLWVPPHQYLDLLAEYGLVGWLELPLWNPSTQPERLGQIRTELEAIVRQYAHHSSIIAWTIGCELGEGIPVEFRQEMVELVQKTSRCPLVRDNSGGAEMYGGDLREFGTFDDFHPYCDTQFFPSVLDCLNTGNHAERPTLLGETNDTDVHRNLEALRKVDPFWASSDVNRNAKGVRWQYDLPHFLAKNRFATAPTENRHFRLMESSRQKALFVRKAVTEHVRARPDFSGYVITGLRDTPISTAGFMDDWNAARFDPTEIEAWNAPDVFYQIPIRRPAWKHGGNRPGYADSRNHFVGRILLRIGLAVEQAKQVEARWSIVSSEGIIVAEGRSDAVSIPTLSARKVAEIHWQCDQPGEFTLVVEAPGIRNAWPIWVLSRPNFEGWTIFDPAEVLSDLTSTPDGMGRISTRFRPESRPSIQFLLDEGTTPCPFWRESAYEFFDTEFWADLGFAERWERLMPISCDRVIDIDHIAKFWGRDYQVLMNRVDVRTYEEAPVLVRYPHGYVTTLRPFGGLGKQPHGVTNNPAGSRFLSRLMHLRYLGTAA